mmetsp:Transcript_22016/g.46413  ORF Transcript_22016/g.46413 Transcript_22016/m.46413 type:complete len:558 (-) Transcript_22016:247-1920(-)|eukprot:CAMPEP_0201122124 /NCGR_PEP_ID=MMETSP0850-20130426/5835_1 /ASSEMBLY_ACC=CAM_ASM_000622 /TAXON_ID=183588 /ORGANISM="Pseudo-nitzschia fraudulenta, Strain WWA7" /LENGTH=557 /DNA_ID=CAMNT_0047388733 /DNA_START=83 /DNA_END=1756 /DNA_ORIENTATION=-
MSSTNNSDLASSDDNFAEDLPDPDEDFILFPEDDQNVASKEFHPEATKKKSLKTPEEPEFILGTVIVRVVAAKGLVNPNHDSGFGGVFRNSPMPINPYASVKFGKTTQRTSHVYSTLDPVWPRDEVFFMDVSLPASRVSHLSESSTSGEIRSSSPMNQNTQNATASLKNPFYDYKKPDNTILTVAIFHTEMGNAHGTQKPHHNEKLSGDSDDTFLGMASIDLTRLFTGKVAELDEWLPLTGTSSDNEGHRHSNYHRGASVRVMCEYEVSDVPPKPGDICRFTRFCHPKDLYPLEPSCCYKVETVDRHNRDVVLLSYESQEGWFLSFQAHKNMLICEERHVSALNTAQDELQTLGERLSVSPLVVSVTEAALKVADDGLVGIAGEMIKGSAFVFDRWFKGGVDTVIRDLQDITNLDGRHNVENVGQRLDLESPDSLTSSLLDENDGVSDEAIAQDTYQEEEAEALPNMPLCPITGLPMVDPVVAADGHTYERSAIARWLTASNKSPMTGADLIHKQLVPNYGLVSSIEEATARIEEKSIASFAEGTPLKIDNDLSSAN